MHVSKGLKSAHVYAYDFTATRKKKELVLIKLKVVENFQLANGAERTHIQPASKNVWHKRKTRKEIV